MVNITQGYLFDDGVKILRIRKTKIGQLVNGKLTIKVKDNNVGVDEFEYDVLSELEIDKLLVQCKKPLIIKTRYIVYFDNVRWEVDVFKKHKEGLVLAEIELENIKQTFVMPEWVMEEVTGIPEYNNNNM